MADEKQLKILKQGVDVWNEWRQHHPDAEINLIEADLVGANLEYANLTRADLREADLSKAYLKNTNLREADLRGANLREAYLTGAFLVLTNFNEAHLTDAKLQGADIRGAKLDYASFGKADFSRSSLEHTSLNGTDLESANLYKSRILFSSLKGAVLTSANLTGANIANSDFTWADLDKTILKNVRLDGVTFGDNDLSDVIGLETVAHTGPSIIGINTIRNSRGKISTVFLRGCGLSDLDIEYAKLANPDLSEKEITDITYKIHELRAGGISVHYNSVFISYSFSDQEFATRIHDNLQNSGVRCWFAPHDIQGGKKIHEQIDAAIQTYDRLLLILSEKSINSEWVKTEIANARQREINEKRQVLFPISIVEFEKIKKWKNFDADTGKDSAREIREYFIPDFCNWKDNTTYRPMFDRLLRDLKAA